MLLMATTMVITACEKDPADSPTPTPTPEPQPGAVTLAETTWEGTVESDYTYQTQQGPLEIHIACTITIDFNDEKAGEMFMNVDITVPSNTAANQSQNETYPCTYVFDGKTCNLYDADNPTELISVIQYNATDKTFTMPIDDAATVEMLGTNVVVLRLTHGTLSF